MTLKFEKDEFRSHVCTLDDYEDIVRIHKSQPKIHGVLKTEAYHNYFCSGVRTILKNNGKNYFIIGTKNSEDRLVGYVICYAPENHHLGFVMIAEGEKRTEKGAHAFASFLFTCQAMYHGVEWFEKRHVFELYTLVPLQEFVGWSRLYSRFSREAYLRFTYSVQSIIEPADQPKTEVEKVFIKDDPPIPRTMPFCIIHASLKPKHRWKYFKDKFQRYDNEEKVLENFYDDQESDS